jgi:Squalene-hopene cyclase C-terminal domain
MATSTDLRAAIEEVQNQLPEEQLAGDIDGLYEADFATRIEERVGALPWWVISAVVHSVIFLLCTLIGVALPPPNMDEVSITTDMAKKEEPKYDQKKKRDIFKNPQEVKAENQVENPVVIHEKAEIAETFETDNDMDNQNARGQEDAISDIPLGGTGVTGSMGVGGGGMAGCFGYRDGGGRRKAVARFGGSPATESAVEAALRWLKRHQESDGHWDNLKYAEGSVQGLGKGGDTGVTGLALLAFLGAGHTSKSGKFRDNVLRAANYLVSQQKADGTISDKRAGSHSLSYSHAIGTLALAELYGMTKDPRFRAPAQKAIDKILAWQNSYSGWRYRPKDGQVDVSVTGWMVMALKSAKIGGLKTDAAGFQGAIKWLDTNTNKKTGHIGYMGRGKQRWQAAVSVCMLSKLLMGFRRDDPMLKKQGGLLLKDLPNWDKMARQDQGHSMYYWYYGTLAMFQLGGEGWKSWNKEMKTTLITNQKQGGPMDGSTKDVDGSWDPVSWVRKYGGSRVYTTALNALTLEVYYRYLPMYAK